jgi:hypothetical protein
VRQDVLHDEVGMHVGLHVREKAVIHHLVYDHGAHVDPSEVSHIDEMRAG